MPDLCQDTVRQHGKQLPSRRFGLCHHPGRQSSQTPSGGHKQTTCGAACSASALALGSQLLLQADRPRCVHPMPGCTCCCRDAANCVPKSALAHGSVPMPRSSAKPRADQCTPHRTQPDTNLALDGMGCPPSMQLLRSNDGMRFTLGDSAVGLRRCLRASKKTRCAQGAGGVAKPYDGATCGT